MMKKRLATLLIASTLGAIATPAMAQFGSLLGALSSSTSASVTPEAFISSAIAAEKLMDNSVTLLSRSMNSKEKAAELEALRKTANETTDPAEKQAKLTEVRKSELAALNEAMANSKIEEDVTKVSERIVTSERTGTRYAQRTI